MRTPQFLRPAALFAAALVALALLGACGGGKDTYNPTLDSGGAATFLLSVSPGSRTIAQGQQTTYTVTVTAQNGFSSPVALTVAGLPADTTATFEPSTITPTSQGATSTLTVQTSGTGVGSLTGRVRVSRAPTPVGTYTLAINGNGGGSTKQATTQLIVQAEQTPMFTMSAAPGSRTVTAGASTTYTVTLNSENGFNTPVDLSVAGLPAGTTASFGPASPITPTTQGAQTTLTVQTAASTPAATSTLTINGSGGGKTNQASVTLIVQAPAGFTPTRFAYLQTFNQSNATVIAQFFVNAQGGLSPASPATIQTPTGSAFEIVRHPTGPFVYVGDANAGKIAQYRVAQDGTLQSLNPSTVGPANSGQFLGNQLAIDPQGRALYTTGNGSSSPDIYQFRINSDGTLTPFNPATVRPVAPGLPSIGFPRGITVDNTGTNAYTVGNGATVTHLRIQSDGSLTPVSTFNLPTQGNLKTVEDVVLAPNGQFAYLVENTQNSITGNAVHQYRVNSDGSLTALTPEFVTVPAGGFEATIEPGGRFLYIGSDEIIRVPINSNGTLGSFTSSFPDPNGIGTPHFDPTGKFALANHGISTGLTMFTVNSDGTLTLVGPVAAATQRVGFMGFFNR